MFFDQEKEIDKSLKASWTRINSTLGLTERLVGITNWPWEFLEIEFWGKGTKKKPFELFDEIICGLLLIEEGIEGERMRELLGLSDELGTKAFKQMLDPLLGSMVEGDESYYFLNERGQEYAKQGAKYENFERTFTLVFDPQNPEIKNAAAMRSGMIGAKNSKLGGAEMIREDILEITENLQELKPYVLEQAPQVHLPEKGFFLDGAKLNNVKNQESEIHIGIIENFQDESIRLLALIPKTQKPIPIINNFLNSWEGEELAEEIIEKFRSEHTEELVLLDKSDSQLADEEWLEEHARMVTEGEVPEPEKIKAIKAQRCNFNTLEFEEEIDWLTRNCRGELWIISPWIRRHAFSRREKQIKELLKNGCKVFLGYSSPHNAGEEMVASPAEKSLRSLQQQNKELFVAELPQFHEKLILADIGNGTKFEYTGSFNVLSFSADGKDRIGRENMRRLKWGKDSDENYQYLSNQFGNFYLEQFKQVTKPLLTLSPALEVKEIKNAEKTLENALDKASPLLTILGGSQQAELEKIKTKIETNLEKARTEIIKQLLEDQRDALLELRPLTKEKAKAEEKTLRDSLASFSLPKETFSLETEEIKSLIQQGRTLDKIAVLTRELKGKEETLLSGEKRKFEDRIQTLKEEYDTLPDSLKGPINKLDELLREKSAVKGLKVVGKIDLDQLKGKKK